MRPPRPRADSSRATLSQWVGLALIVALALLLASPGCGHTLPTVPQSVRELEAARERAELFLTPEGKRMARGKSAGATLYSIDSRLDTSSKTVNLEERVLYTNRSPDTLSEIVFRVTPNDPATNTTGRPAAVSRAKVDGRAAESSLAGSLLRVKVPDPLRAGKKTSVTFDFSEPVPALSGGNSGSIFGYSEGTFDLGGFIPTVAVYSGGTWDTRAAPAFGDVQFYDCSYYFVSFDAPAVYTVAATGVQTGTQGGRRTFTAGPARDFEVQVSRDYRSTARKVSETTVTSYYLSGHPEAGRAALDSGCSSLSEFSARFGPYPYTRLNVCEAPMDDYGMEFTGQVQIGSFLYENPGNGELEYTVAHEVSHQWWAIVVGNDSIGHAWQDESLASYSEALHALWSHGSAEARKYVADELAGNYLVGREDGEADTVVDQALSGFSDGDQYTAVVYGKGAVFFDRLLEMLGERRFETSLAAYYMKYAFQNAPPDALAGAFGESGTDKAGVDALFDRWIQGVHGDEDIGSRS